MTIPPNSATRPQSAREEAQPPQWEIEKPERYWDPSKQLLSSIRTYTRAKQTGGAIGYVVSKFAVLRYRFWSAVTGADLPLNSTSIGGGLILPHANGIVIHPDVIVGPNCRLFQQVTLGTGPRPGVPVIGAHVDIGAGAKILGGVTIGDFAVIGANAVVISDIPAGATAVGVPAVVKRYPRGQWDSEARSSRGSSFPPNFGHDQSA